jgi:hypothetical protein
VTIGDIITLSATVSEWRGNTAFIYLTELVAATQIIVLSKGNKVTPLVIDETFRERLPTEQFSSLDNGNVFGLPNNDSRISVVNPTLQPLLYGLDFWESLSGEFVTVKKPIAVSKSSVSEKLKLDGNIWIVGSGFMTGKNERGGLTSTELGMREFWIMKLSFRLTNQDLTPRLS